MVFFAPVQSVHFFHTGAVGAIFCGSGAVGAIFYCTGAVQIFVLPLLSYRQGLQR